MEELQSGAPSASALQQLQEKLRGGKKALALATQMLLALSAALPVADPVGVDPPMLLQLCEATWRVVHSRPVPVSVLESIGGALQDLGSAVSKPSHLLKSLTLALEQLQLLWVVTQRSRNQELENQDELEEQREDQDQGQQSSDADSVSSANSGAETEAGSLASTWHRTFIGIDVLLHLMALVKARGLQLPRCLAGSGASLLAELLESPCASPAREESQFPGGSRESLRAKIFEAVGVLALLSNSTRGDFAGSGWGRILPLLIAEIADVSRRPLGLLALQGASHACGNVLHAAPVERLQNWVGPVLQGTQRRLEDSDVVKDTELARDLLCVLGDIYAFSPAPLHQTVVGPGGTLFNLSCSLILSAASYAERTPIDGCQDSSRQLRLGSLEALEGTLVFLKTLEISDAAQGFAMHAERVLRMLDHTLLCAHTGEEISLGLKVLHDLLRLCSRDPPSQPWCMVLSFVGKVRGWPAVMDRAKFAGFEKEAARLMLCMGKLGLTLSTEPHSGPFGLAPCKKVQQRRANDRQQAARERATATAAAASWCEGQDLTALGESSRSEEAEAVSWEAASWEAGSAQPETGAQPAQPAQRALPSRATSL